MKRLIAAGLLLVGSWAGPSQASFLTGNKLQTVCGQSRDECTAYIMGALDMMSFSQMTSGSGKFLCMPDSVDSDQVTDVVLKYVRDNPEKRHWPAGAVVWAAAVSAFPCNAPPKP